MMHEFVDGIKKYVDFEGRTSRRDFWMFMLWSFVISLVLGIVGGIIRMSMLGNLFSLFVFIPSLSITVRRLHDISYSGWWALFGIIPFLGWLVVIVLMTFKGTPADNQYGPVVGEAVVNAPAPAPAPVAPAPTPEPTPTEEIK